MSAAYLVTIPAFGVGQTLQQGVNTVVVHASSEADAKAAAKAALSADNNASWTDATATTIVAASNLIGFRFVIKEYTELGVLARNTDFTCAGAAQDTMDEVGALLATALGGGAAYTAGSNLLTLTAAAGGDGDHTLSVKVYMPTADGQDVEIPGFLGTVVHQGLSSAALSVVFLEPTLPKVYALAKRIA
jgi:hypothetical protein